MPTNTRSQRLLISAGVLLAVLAGLFWARHSSSDVRHSYLLFHTLAELLSVVIGVSIFVVAWNTRRFARDSFPVVVGCAFLVVAALDLVHAMAYKGMPLFPGYDSNLPTQLWILSRYYHAIALLLAVFFLGRRTSAPLLLGVNLLLLALALVTVLHWDVFPACFIELPDGSGQLTPFKIASEYVICGLFALLFAGLWMGRRRFEPEVLWLLAGGVIVTIVQELAFTLYTDPYGWWNFAGHCLKVIALVLFYKAIAETALARPYDLLFYELRRSEAHYRELMENLSAGVVVHAADGRVSMSNRRACELLAVSAIELAGKPPAELRPSLVGENEQLLQAGEHPVEKAIETGAPVNDQLLGVRGVERERVWLLANAFPVRDAAGRLEQVICTYVDISARRALEISLHRAKETAEHASAAKDHFIAALSHELRTPLTPALAAASSLAADQRLPAELTEDARIIERNIELEIALINDLLDVTRIVTGKLALRKEPVSLAQIIGEAILICRADAQARRQQLTVELPAETLSVHGDFTRLHQVFWNLIKNAIKFTPEGGAVSVRAHADGRAAHVTVRDTGIGISPAALASIFDAFEQGDSGHHFGGLGLGLAIARGVVVAHGGELRAHSDGPGHGATFTVSLPLSAAGPLATPAAPAPPPPARELRLLVVEDHADTARMMSRLLRSAGHTVSTSGDLQSALKLLGESRFDIVVSDLGLPDGSGLELMRQIRVRYPHMRGIALSGYGQPEDIRRSGEAGFAEHLTKPVTPARLMAALAEVGALSPPVHEGVLV